LLTANDLVWPVFIKDGKPPRAHQISSWFVTVCSLEFKPVYEIESLLPLGLKAVALFPQISDELKSPQADEALNPEGLVACRDPAVERAVSSASRDHGCGARSVFPAKDMTALFEMAMW